jgi:hypothetical protein
LVSVTCKKQQRQLKDLFCIQSHHLSLASSDSRNIDANIFQCAETTWLLHGALWVSSAEINICLPFSSCLQDSLESLSFCPWPPTSIQSLLLVPIPSALPHPQGEAGV